MSVFILILITISAGVGCFFIGRLLGNWIGKKQQMQDEVRRNGSKHR